MLTMYLVDRLQGILFFLGFFKTLHEHAEPTNHANVPKINVSKRRGNETEVLCMNQDCSCWPKHVVNMMATPCTLKYMQYPLHMCLSVFLA